MIVYEGKIGREGMIGCEGMIRHEGMIGHEMMNRLEETMTGGDNGGSTIRHQGTIKNEGTIRGEKLCNPSHQFLYYQIQYYLIPFDQLQV